MIVTATSSGPAACLDDIPRKAGFGFGTLYRHFLTREALIEAVYGNKVRSSPPRSSASLLPCIRSKLSGRGCFSSSGTLVGVFLTTELPGWEESVRRIVDILIAGSRAKNEPT